MTEEQFVSKNQLISKLLHISHGKFDIYRDVGIAAAQYEPELFGHFLSWNLIKGEVRDSKVAMPVCALRGVQDDELFENAVGALCSLDPRNLWKAIKFNSGLSPNDPNSLPADIKNVGKDGAYPISEGAGRWLKDGIKRYLILRQRPPLRDMALLQHKDSMKSLYKHFHVKPDRVTQAVLFDGKYPKGSIFEAVANLHKMSAIEAAGAILNKKIPFNIAVTAVKGVKDKPDLILALMENMSGAELINNTNALKKMGVFDDDVLAASYEKSLERAKKDKRVSTLKAGKAASILAKEGGVAAKKAAKKLGDLQEDKLDKLEKLEGDWLVLGDKSPSMEKAIGIAVEISGLIAKQVKGKVYLIFFNDIPKFIDVTGNTLEEIRQKTSRIRTGGMTSIGCGIDYCTQKNLVVNGIALVSDGVQNTAPDFYSAYKKYAVKLGIEPTVYHLLVKGRGPGSGRDLLTRNDLVQMEKFDLGYGDEVDYYSLPNIVKTLRANRYALVDEIMDTPLLTFSNVFKLKGA